MSSVDFWAIVGKIGVLLSSLWAAFQIIRAFRSPTSKLNATAEAVNFDFPPDIKDLLIRSRDFFKAETIKENLANQFVLEEATLAEISVFVEKYAERLLPKEIPWEISYYGSMLQMVIKNNGTALCEGVSLAVPQMESVSIIREGEKPLNLKCSGVINIGDIKPQESVNLKAWCNHSVLLWASKIRLTHRTGVVKVSHVPPCKAGLKTFGDFVTFLNPFLIFFITYFSYQLWHIFLNWKK